MADELFNNYPIPPQVPSFIGDYAWIGVLVVFVILFVVFYWSYRRGHKIEKPA